MELIPASVPKPIMDVAPPDTPAKPDTNPVKAPADAAISTSSTVAKDSQGGRPPATPATYNKQTLKLPVVAIIVAVASCMVLSALAYYAYNKTN